MNYQVFLNNEKIPVYHCKNSCVCSFELKGEGKLKVVCENAISSHSIHPVSYNVQSENTENEIVITLEKPQKLSLIVNDDINYPLIIFADTPQTTPVIDDNTIYYKAGQEYYVGEIRLQSNQKLYIERGAIVHGYVLAENARNITIDGYGILNASEHDNGLRIYYCKDVKINGLTMIKGGQEWGNRIFCSENVIITDYKSITWGRYSDGIDILGSNNVVIDNVFVQSEDDSIVIKCDKFGFRGNVSDVVVRNSVIWNGRGGNALEIGYELNGDYIKNVLFENIDIIRADSPGFYFRCGAMTIHNAGDCTVSDITYRDIRVESAEQEFIHICTIDDMQNWGKGGGKIANILFDNISLNGGEAVASVIRSNDAKRIKNVTFKSMNYLGKAVKTPEDANMIVENSEVKFIY